MDKFEKSAEFIMKRGDMVIAERKRRKLIILRSGAISLGALAVLGIGIFTNVMKPPKRPIPDQSGIITESSETVTTSAITAAETTSEKTTASVSASTATVTVSGTKAHTSTAVTSAPKLTETARTTAVRTTAQTSPTSTAVTFTRTTAIITTAKQTTTITVTTASQTSDMVTTRSDVQTTQAGHTTNVTQTGAMETTVPSTTNVSQSTTTAEDKWLGFFYGENYDITYRAAWNNSEKVTVTKDELGEYRGVENLRISYTMSKFNYEEEPCKVYTIKRFSPDFALAVQSKNDDAPKLYYTSANFATLGELIEATDMENILVLEEAYWEFGPSTSVPLGTAKLSDLMKALSDRSSKSLHSSVMGGSASYTVWAEIPMFGNFSVIRILTAQPKASYGYISLDIFGDNCTYKVPNDKLEEFIRSFGGTEW